MNKSIEHHPVRLRRSVLSVPADNARALAKVAELATDAAIFDLEDSVAPEKKAEARENLKAFFSGPPLPNRERIIRINALSSEFGIADLDLVLALQPDAVLLPKVDEPQDVMAVSDRLADADAGESLRIWAMIETPKGILNAAAIAEAGRTPGSRLDCFVVGLNDLRKDTGVLPRPGRAYLVSWLMQVVLAARAFGLTVVDSVSNDFRNLAPFEAECAQGRAMGFDGKMLIHPAQIDAANKHFQPSADEVAEAEAIIAAFSKPEAEGLNATSIDGRMVERLHYQQALALMARVEMIKSRTAA